MGLQTACLIGGHASIAGGSSGVPLYLQPMFFILCYSAIATTIHVIFNCDISVITIRSIIDVTVLNTCFEYWFIADFGKEVKERKDCLDAFVKKKVSLRYSLVREMVEKY